MKSQLTIAVAMVASAATAKQDVCRALVLSGGGNNGAWEVGVFSGMLANGDPADFEFDVVTGVSAGSINAGGFAGWEIGNEVAAA